MGTVAQSALPVIDLSEESHKPGSPSTWGSKCDQVRAALEDFGCFVAIYDQVPAQLQAQVFEACEDLFDQPAEAKARNLKDGPYHGYYTLGTGKVPCETMGISCATTLAGVGKFVGQVWPSGNDIFYDTMAWYAKKAAGLDQLVVKMLCQSYGVNKFYESYEDATNYLLKFLKYIGPAETRAHTDRNFISVLSQNEVNGLVVKTKDGDWIGYEPQGPSSFIVMGGEAAMVWSNGRIYPPVHKVKVISENATRYTVASFSYNKGIIEVAEELIDDEHPRKFKSFDHYGLLAFHIDALAKGNPSSTMDYCGV